MLIFLKSYKLNMKKIILILIGYLSVTFCNAQTISCDDLFNYIADNGFKKQTVSNYMMNSSWLYEVTAYQYEYKIYVVAKIKQDDYGYRTRSYIFCGIPTSNWNGFVYGGYGDSNSYGERFHRYIEDYKCNCD